MEWTPLVLVSTTPGNTPTPDEFDDDVHIAINEIDGKLFTRDGSGGVRETALDNLVTTDSNPSTFGAIMLIWFLSLPTTLPASPNVLWNNGGILALS